MHVQTMNKTLFEKLTIIVSDMRRSVSLIIAYALITDINQYVRDSTNNYKIFQ